MCWSSNFSFNTEGVPCSQTILYPLDLRCFTPCMTTFLTGFWHSKETHWCWRITGTNHPTGNRNPLLKCLCSIYKCTHSTHVIFTLPAQSSTLWVKYYRPCLHIQANIVATKPRTSGLILNAPTVSFILRAGCKNARREYKSAHLRTNRLSFKWNGFWLQQLHQQF